MFVSCPGAAVQKCQEADKDLSVCIVEKGAEVGELFSCHALPVDVFTHRAPFSDPIAAAYSGLSQTTQCTYALQGRTFCQAMSWSPGRCMSYCQTGKSRVHPSMSQPLMTGMGFDVDRGLSEASLVFAASMYV